MRMGVSPDERFRVDGTRASRRSLARRLLLLGQRILRSDTHPHHRPRGLDDPERRRRLSGDPRRRRGGRSARPGRASSRPRHHARSATCRRSSTTIWTCCGLYCTAEVQRDVARVTYLSEQPDLPALVTANLTLDGLRPLLLGDQDAECAADSERATRCSEPPSASRAGSRTSRRRVERFGPRSAGGGLHRDEAFLMTAGFLFAFVVAAIIAIDQFGSRATRPVAAAHARRPPLAVRDAAGRRDRAGDRRRAARRLRRRPGAHGADPGRTRGRPHRRVAPGCDARRPESRGRARPQPDRATRRAAARGRSGGPR